MLGKRHKGILVNILQEILDWRSNLDLPQSSPDRGGWNNDDKGTIRSLQFWLRSYYNGMVLMGLANAKEITEETVLTQDFSEERCNRCGKIVKDGDWTWHYWDQCNNKPDQKESCQ